MELNSSEITKYIQIAKRNHKEGKLKEANQIYKSLINKKFFTYDLLISYGLFNKEINNLKIAKNLFTISIKKYPLFIRPYLFLAEILSLENSFKEALRILFLAKEIEQNNSNVDYNLSILYKKNKLYKEALNYINKALIISPKIEIYKILKADILIDNFQNQEAEQILGNLIFDKNSNLYFQKELLFSRIFINQKNYVEAEHTLLKLKNFFNNQPILFLNLSNLYFNNKEINKGIKVSKEGIKKFPNFIPLKFNLAVMYRNSGHLDSAINMHLEILDKDKFNFNSYYELSTLYDFSSHNDQLNNLLNIEIENLTPIQKIYIGFSKANIYHYKGEFENSAYFLKIANDEKLKLRPSDLKRKLNTGEIYRNFKFENQEDSNENLGNNCYLFIVGMPRCGSTLLESILSLNSEVKDLGEVFFLEESLKETVDLKKVNDTYSKKVLDINSFKNIFTDKNLFNFLYCPIIYRFFPNSRIIHCTRNPLDNVLSIYRTNFINQSFSSSLKDIAKLYTYHIELMDEYKTQFGSIIYSYDHDQVVQNPEASIRKLIDWLNWEWDEKYLSPHKNKRNVFTASSAQVRKEINNQSINYWEKYKQLLKPLSSVFPTYDLLNG